MYLHLLGIDADFAILANPKMYYNTGRWKYDRSSQLHVSACPACFLCNFTNQLFAHTPSLPQSTPPAHPPAMHEFLLS